MAYTHSVQLHPPGGTPRGPQDRETRLDAPHGGQHLGHRSAPVAEVEVLHIRVRLSAGVVVRVGRRAGQIGRRDAVSEEAEVRAGGREQLPDELVPLVGGERVHHGDGGVGHRTAEADDGLLVSRWRIIDGQLPLRAPAAPAPRNWGRDRAQLATEVRGRDVGGGPGQTALESRRGRHRKGLAGRQEE